MLENTVRWILFGLICVLVGCGQNSWKSPKKIYETYISPPACINYGSGNYISKNEMIFTVRMIGIDSQLEALTRYLQNADKPPTNESTVKLFEIFPWLSGVAVLEPDGTILSQEPTKELQEDDFRGILEARARGSNFYGLRGYAQETSAGPKVFVAMPIYIDSEIKCLFVVYFDMDKLSTYSAYSKDIMIFTPETLLWSGQFEFSETPAYGENWKEILRHYSSGRIYNKTDKFLWMTHYIGRQPLIFSTPIEGVLFNQTEKSCAN